jgi:hypothetical protein
MLACLTMVLLAAWPFVSFLNKNQDELLTYGGAVALYWVGYVVAVSVVAMLAIAILGRRRVAPIAHVFGVGSVLLFSYLPLSQMLSGFGIALGSIRIAIWLVLSLVVLTLIWRLSKKQATMTVLLVVACAMEIVPAVGLAAFWLRDSAADQAAVVAAPTVASAERTGNRPNVYWFVFDAYARADVLADYFDKDNSGFTAALASRGFSVADAALSNYASTKLSISTTASMDYYLPVGERLSPLLWTARLEGFNPVVERFRELGYRYIHAEPGGNNLKTRCGGIVDQCIKSASRGVVGVSEAEVGLLQLTPLFPIIRRLAPDFLSFDFTTVEDVTGHLNFSSDRPFFLFAHILSPHPPQRFDRKCAYLKNVDFDLAGEDYSDLIDGYVSDLGCLNARILAAVDLILEKDRTDPVIILQSDHGFRGTRLKPAHPDPRVPVEFVSFANLHAMRAPESCDRKSDESFSLVNTFRIVLSCIDGQPRELLPDRHFVNRKEGLDEVKIDQRPTH